MLWAIAGGGVAFGLVFVAGSALSKDGTAAMLSAIAAGVLTAFALAWNRIDKPEGLSSTAARAIEQAVGSLDNLVVTAAELIEKPTPTRAEIREEILRQADQRLANADLSRVAPLAHPSAVALAVLIGCAALASTWTERATVIRGGPPAELRTSSIGIDSMTVRIAPPSYTGRDAETFENPVQVTALAGSRVQLEVRSGATGVVAEAVGVPAITLEKQQDRFVAGFIASRSTSFAVRSLGDRGAEARFVSILVTPDAAPSVRVRAPGRDTAMAGPKGQIALEVEGIDDLGLASLALKFTKASGGGESLTFIEGEVPLSIARRDDRRWTATARWVLDALGLADGDVLVYSAVARDRNPSGAPVQSEQYLIEIGRASENASAGFGLPAEEKKYGISQQMVIYKTEQLLAARAKHGADSWIEQGRMLAIEQRMVRAEVVFLGGGEVEDEVEEAAHSDELAEGRLQNAGRAEMLRAINFMSRAEAQLNDGRAAEALLIERQALRALELAFDRRRYFLRTLPDRSRIDTSRRLTGALTGARSWTKDDRRPHATAALDAQRSVMRDLASSVSRDGRTQAVLAARVAAIDPGSADLQKVAVQLATAVIPEAYRVAAEMAMQAVAAHAQAALASPVGVRLPADPLAGRLADELRRAPLYGVPGRPPKGSSR